MTTLKERTLLNSSMIWGKPFIGNNRRKRIFDKLRKSREKDPGLEKDLDDNYDEERYYMISMNEEGVKKLGEIARINGDLNEFLNGFLGKEEREIKEKYDLSFYQVFEYGNRANEIIDWGDRDILVRLGIPVDNPSRLSDAYRRVLYYVAELCNNQREIRGDFFRAVS